MKIIRNHRFLENLAHEFAHWTGSSWAFLITLTLALIWIISGPFFEFSAAWQHVMNSVSNVTAFVMVFLLQRSQNKTALAMQIKLNEIISVLKGANNHLIGLEDSSEGIIRSFQEDHQHAAMHIRDNDVASTGVISIDDMMGLKE